MQKEDRGCDQRRKDRGGDTDGHPTPGNDAMGPLIDGRCQGAEADEGEQIPVALSQGKGPVGDGHQ